MINYTKANLALHVILLNDMECLQPFPCAFGLVSLEFSFRKFEITLLFRLRVLLQFLKDNLLLAPSIVQYRKPLRLPALFPLILGAYLEQDVDVRVYTNLPEIITLAELNRAWRLGGHYWDYALVAITGTIGHVPYFQVESMQLIWRDDTRKFQISSTITWQGAGTIAPAMVVKATCFLWRRNSCSVSTPKKQV